MRYGGQEGSYGGSGGTFANPAFTGTVSGGSAVIGASGLAFINAPTGTMADNGAITLGTALGATYSEGAWMYLPANAIEAGSAAGWYWCVMSNTTAGTVYNSTYTTGSPTAGTATAFATTGPGAYTGVTTEQGITIPMVAGQMGLNGVVVVEAQWAHNNSAGAKTGRIRLGGSSGTEFYAVGHSTTTGELVEARIANAGKANFQRGFSRYINSGSAWSLQATATAAIDTSAASSVYISATKAVATDYAVIIWLRVAVDRVA